MDATIMRRAACGAEEMKRGWGGVRSGQAKTEMQGRVRTHSALKLQLSCSYMVHLALHEHTFFRTSASSGFMPRGCWFGCLPYISLLRFSQYLVPVEF